MTISLNIGVNGAYRATVVHGTEGSDVTETIIVDGNPSGPMVQKPIYFQHGVVNTITVTEEPLPAPTDQPVDG